MEKEITVLIVDDEMDMRIYMSALFKTSGYTPIAVANGTDGLHKAEEIRPSLIILDVMMPGEGGVTMYRELKRNPELKTIPVIMLSAVSKESFQHYLDMLNPQLEQPIQQPDHYMEKPPDAERLLSVVRHILSL